MEPNFGLSGALAEETNTVNNVALVYSEPPEAAHPTLRWRLYTFKGGLCQPVSRRQHWILLHDATDNILTVSKQLLLTNTCSNHQHGNLTCRGTGGRAPVYTPTEQLPFWQRETGGRHTCRPSILQQTAFNFAVQACLAILGALHSLIDLTEEGAPPATSQLFLLVSQNAESSTWVKTCRDITAKTVGKVAKRR